MPKTSTADRSRSSMPDLDLLATQPHLVIRDSHKFSPGGFLQLLLGSVATGLASINQIAGDLKDRVAILMAGLVPPPTFRHPLHRLFMAILSDLMTQRFKPAAAALEPSAIRRIVIEDASGQIMPKSNAELFPAHGNQHGTTAGRKIDFVNDLLTGTMISHSSQAATIEDETIEQELVAEVRSRDLVLLDMG